MYFFVKFELLVFNTIVVAKMKEFNILSTYFVLLIKFLREKKEKLWKLPHVTW
jgi:hypothetical protein